MDIVICTLFSKQLNERLFTLFLTTYRYINIEEDREAQNMHKQQNNWSIAKHKEQCYVKG